MTKLFISYSHVDRPFATRLAQALGGRGYDVWIDEAGIHGGARWSTSVQEGLDTCDALVLVVSPSSMASKHVEDEWQYVLDQGKPVLPVMLEPTKVHFQLGRIHYVDFAERDFDHALDQLTKSITRVVGGAAEGEASSEHAPGSVEPEASPYRGLQAFREQDAPYFFGRESFTKMLVEAVRNRPMVAVIGPSGSGKSSVVHAGLLPALRSPEVNGGNEGGWTVLGMRPGDSPIHAVAGALVPLLEPDITTTGRLVEVRRLGDALTDGTVRLAEVLELLAEKRQDVGQLLLLADQFEELYTLCPEERTRRAFQDLLFETAFQSGRGIALKLGLTLRADFMGHALAYRPFADAVQHHQVLLGPMNRDELARAIVKPAELHGYRFESGLVERIMDDVGDKAGRLPLLEFALAKLWEAREGGRLTHAAYEQIGYVEGAVARHADAVYERLDETDRLRTRRVFVQLVQPGEGTEDTRRIATHAELEDDWDLVHRLAGDRLVTTGLGTDGEQTVEVVHEALIRSWGRLIGWMRHDRRFRTWQERLRFAIRQWSDADRDPDALLRGVPLAEAADWSEERGDELVAAEQAFIEESVALREQRQAERDARRQRELDAAHQLAKAERKRAEHQAHAARTLRRRAVYLGGALAASAALAVAAWSASRSATRQAELARSSVLAARARTFLERHDTERALALALEAADIEDPPSDAVRVLAEAGLGPGTRFVLDGHSQAVTSVAISPGGETLYAASSAIWTGEAQSEDKAIRVWSMVSGEEIGRLDGAGEAAHSIAVSPDGNRMAAGLTDGRVALWDTRDRRLRRTWQAHSSGTRARVREIMFVKGNEQVLTGGSDGAIRLWDVERGLEVAELEDGGPTIWRLALDDTQRHALAIDSDDRVRAWDLETGKEVFSYEADNRAVHRAVAFVPGRHEAVLALADRLEHRDLETGALIREFPLPGEFFDAVVVSPDWCVRGRGLSLERRVRLGAGGPVADPSPFAATTPPSTTWPSARMVAPWPPPRPTGPCGCGTCAMARGWGCCIPRRI